MIVEEVCSSYSFHQAPMWYSWEVARESCQSAQYTDLVSMESNDEWEYLKNIVKKKKGLWRRWDIGLKYSSSKWCWLSNTSNCINQTLLGKWRWSEGEPNHLGMEHCVEMLNDGTYNNVACRLSYRSRGVFMEGYICEQKAGKNQHL